MGGALGLLLGFVWGSFLTAGIALTWGVRHEAWPVSLSK